MIPLSAISNGDRVSFFCPLHRHVTTRTVRTVRADHVEIRHGKEGNFVLRPEQIKSVAKINAFEGNNPLDKEMRRRGVTNVTLAEKAGYSARTVVNAREGHKVKDVTMSDIMQALGAL